MMDPVEFANQWEAWKNEERDTSPEAFMGHTEERNANRRAHYLIWRMIEEHPCPESYVLSLLRGDCDEEVNQWWDPQDS